MPIKSHVGLLRRRPVWAAGVIAALAIAAPVAEASAQPAAAVPLPAAGGLGALGGWLGGFPGYALPVGLLTPGAIVAKGPTVVGSVANGGTTVVISNGLAVGNTIASP
jgi:hypothetical protein